MIDEKRTKADLISELRELRLKVQSYETRNAEQGDAGSEAAGGGEDKFKILFNSVEDAIFVHGINDEGMPENFIEVNEMAVKRYGYTRQELLNMSPLEIDAPEILSDISKKVSTVMAKGSANFESLHVAKDGTKIPVDVKARLFDYEGKKAIISIGRDITERIESAKMIVEQNEFLKNLIESIPHPLYVIDVDDCKVKIANSAARDEEHFDLNTCLKKIQGLDFSCKAEGDMCPVEIVREKGGPIVAEHIFKDKSGKDRYCEVTSYPIFHGDGKLSQVVEYTIDVTDRKMVEEELKRYANELEKANEDVKNFSYIVSHDLKGPLINIKGYSEKIGSANREIHDLLIPFFGKLSRREVERILTILNDEVPKYMDFIDSSIGRISGLISAILRLSRLGRRELIFSTVEMNKVVDSSLMNLAHKIEEQGIKVKIGELHNVVADKTSMQIIIENLLTNAVNYLCPKRRGEIEIGSFGEMYETTFYIKDNGVGIDKKDMGRIFNVFQRAGKQDIPGEGMGLAYVRTLVERHNGRIWCESKVDEGSIFKFTISRRLEKIMKADN
ncbi:MAG: PAS domain S-box protein [Deltaproteobacteria bacterium]|uniref:histidine kinase n=1 Tax=Candidatus Zymogenus saltonus TaxID=2844893 RepID=A0A9D8KEX9_9DELT|nr:PAS domain S-box protein [Candidatus Zymogenus saltonus]